MASTGQAPITAIAQDGTLYPIEKLRAHTEDVPHKAISVFLFDGSRTLMQRRAAAKYHSGGLWANACCTHPAWGEDDEASAFRRLAEELNIEAALLTSAGRYRYRAEVGGGLVENEDAAVFVGRVMDPDNLPAPTPEEVAEIAWRDWDAVAAEAANPSFPLAAWTRIYLNDAELRGRILAARDRLMAGAGSSQ